MNSLVNKEAQKSKQFDFHMSDALKDKTMTFLKRVKYRILYSTYEKTSMTPMQATNDGCFVYAYGHPKHKRHPEQIVCSSISIWIKQ